MPAATLNPKSMLAIVEFGSRPYAVATQYYWYDDQCSALEGFDELVVPAVVIDLVENLQPKVVMPAVSHHDPKVYRRTR